MKRFLTGLLILVLAMGLFQGCKEPEIPATEPFSDTTPREEAQDPEGHAEGAEEESFPVPTGLPHQGKVMEQCLFHDGSLYTSQGYKSSLPEGSELIGKIETLDEEELPDEELEAAQFYLGMKVYALSSGKILFVEFDSSHYLQLEPYDGDTEDLFIPDWQRKRAFLPKLSSEVDASRIFHIAVMPNEDRDLVIDRVVSGLRVGLLYDLTGEKTFSVYAGSLIENSSMAMAWMRSLKDVSGVLSVERPQSEYPGEKLSDFGNGTEMVPADETPAAGTGWTEYEILEEAEAALGMTFEIPENDLEKIYRGCVNHGMNLLEVIFLKNGKEVYRLRKGKGYGDPSGDHLHFHRGYYSDDKHGGLETFYKNDEGNDLFFTAYRLYSDYSYSVTVSEAMTQEELLKFFTDDKHKQPEWLEHPNSRDIMDYMPEKWKDLEPVTERTGEEEVVSPTDDTAREAFSFPRQGEDGRTFSETTLIIAIDPEFDRDTVVGNLLTQFPIELKYDYSFAENLIAVTTKEKLTETELYELARNIWATTGVSQVTRDAINQLDVVHETTVLSDI